MAKNRFDLIEKKQIEERNSIEICEKTDVFKLNLNKFLKWNNVTFTKTLKEMLVIIVIVVML